MKQNNPKYNQKPKSTINENILTNNNKDNNIILWFIIAFIVPVLVYIQTIGFGYTHFDDDGMITTNLAFLSNFKNAGQAFLTDQFINHTSAFYRPLGTLSYMLDIKLSGVNSTWMFHLSNVLFLGLIASSLFILLKRFSLPLKLALLLALTFCVHPLFVSTIAHIPNRAELMLILFSILSFIFLIDFIQKGKVIYLLLNWLAFTFALFCKETAAFLPFIFLIYYFSFPTTKGFRKIYLLSILLYGVSGLFWLWMRSKAIVILPNKDDIFGLSALILNLRIIPESLAKFFIPFDLAPIPGFTILKTITGLLILLLIIILTIKPFKKDKDRTLKEKIFCHSWYLILIIPSMLYKHPLIDYLDHRFMLPLLGLLLFIVFNIPKKWLLKNINKSYWILMVLIIILSSITIIKSQSYANPMTFYNSVIAHNPNSSLAYNNRGFMRKEKNNPQGALDDFNKSIALNPNFANTYCNRGIVKASMKDNSGAVEDYNKAIQIDSNFIVAYNNRGIANNSLGNFKQAVIDYTKAIKLKPGYAEAYFNRGIANVSMGNLKVAIADYDSAIAINKNYSEAYYSKGIANMNSGNMKEAIVDFNKAIAIRPDYSEAYNNKGTAMGSTGDLKSAVECFNKAIELNSGYVEAFVNRAFAKYFLKDFKSANEDCDYALKLNPNYEKAKNIKNGVMLELQKTK